MVATEEETGEPRLLIGPPRYSPPPLRMEGVIVTSGNQYVVFEVPLSIVTKDQVCFSCPLRD